jgi:hypothetical protein
MEVCTYYNAGFTGAVAYVNKIENNIVASTNNVGETSLTSAYPNPTTGTIQFDGNINSIELIDATGVIVLSASHINQINTANIEPGVYTLMLDDTAQTIVIK